MPRPNAHDAKLSMIGGPLPDRGFREREADLVFIKYRLVVTEKRTQVIPYLI
jgi:hypothetical protein